MTKGEHMSTQPEALRLAKELDAYHTAAHHKQAAAELRRLHAANQAMLEALTNAPLVNQRMDEAVDAIEEALAQPEQEHCQCPACKDGKLHWSDCAVHDEPALAAELCNCGVVNPRIVTQRDTPSKAFFDWWDSDYDDSRNPFRKDAFAYWAWAGWQAALAQTQEPVETYIHEFTKHPHPGDFGIPKGHWWQAKQYAEQLCACYPAPQPAQPEQEQHMKTVSEMVRAAGFPAWDDHEPITVDMYARFADLVRADEREACAKVCDDNDPRDGSGYSMACEDLADDIRARSNT